MPKVHVQYLLEDGGLRSRRAEIQADTLENRIDGRRHDLYYVPVMRAPRNPKRFQTWGDFTAAMDEGTHTEPILKPGRVLTFVVDNNVWPVWDDLTAIPTTDELEQRLDALDQYHLRKNAFGKSERAISNERMAQQAFPILIGVFAILFLVFVGALMNYRFGNSSSGPATVQTQSVQTVGR